MMRLRCDENESSKLTKMEVESWELVLIVGEEKKRSDNTREWVLDGEDYEREKEREEDDSGDYGSANASV